MSTDIQELETLMEEYSTIDDIESVPTDAIKVPYLMVKLWPHQYQAIYLALKAEAGGPVVNKDGEVFYSRSGIQCLGTGTGKTMIMLGVSNFSVDSPAINANLAATSLNTIKLNKIPRQNIDCTVIVADRKIIKDAWLSDLGKGYPSLPFYFFETIGTFETDVEKSPVMVQLKQKQFQIKQYMGAQLNAFLGKQLSQLDFEVNLSRFGDIKSEADIKDYFKTMEDDYIVEKRKAVNEALIRIMSSVKIFFVTKDSFYFLFELFKSYTISRMILDEPQNTTLTEQKLFREYLKDPRMNQLRSAGMGKMLPYYEESPCRFLWYVSATPHLIGDNNDKHYFNSWVAKNDMVITDYSNNKAEDRLFPELSSRYVIKFPYSYIIEKSRPDFQQYVNRFILKASRAATAAILKGALGEEFDIMLENDDYEGIISKLKVGGNINTILESSVERLRIDIAKHENDIKNYDPSTAQGIIDKSMAKLAEEKKNLANVISKINRYRGVQNSSVHEECPICMGDLHIIPQPGDTPGQRCISHMGCMNIFHLDCIKPVIMGANKTCPTCREPLTEKDLKLTCDASGLSLQQQESKEQMENRIKQQQITVLDTEKEYDSKMEALKAALGPMVRNGQYRRRQKVLLFVEFKSDETTKCDEIIRLCQDCGFNVRLPNKIGKNDDVIAKYPTRNGMIVKQAGAANSIKTEIKNFCDKPDPYVWIFRSGKESAGLNFPFVDTSIEYSVFKSHKQIIGRSLRLNRVVPVDLIRLDYI